MFRSGKESSPYDDAKAMSSCVTAVPLVLVVKGRIGKA